jgi:predicted alternative tryptophan synthase beta-subunit
MQGRKVFLTNPPLPPLHPETAEPSGLQVLAPLFPQALIDREMTREAPPLLALASLPGEREGR